MRQRVLHITSLLLLMALACQCLVSCVYEDFDDGIDDGKAVLIIRAASLDSRSADDVERLHSLRVIILHAGGSVEENYYVSDLGGAVQHDHLFSVSGMETKKIYIVANEGSIPGIDLSNLEYDPDPAKTLEGITFEAVPSDATGNPVFKEGIPMSACYEVTIGSESTVEKDFFLVRAMTKFTFTFQNVRTHNVKVKEMKVSAFADKTYLLPQFTDGNSAKVGSEKFTVDAVGDYNPASGRFWIDWLSDAVDKSQTGLYTPDEIGWIKNYTLPAGATHDNPLTGIAIKYADEDADAYEIKPFETWTYPQTFYRCESMNAAGDGGVQDYAISYLRVRDSHDESDMAWTDKPFLKLDQVKYLFRHTHVNVNVVLGQEDVVIYARIHPWIVIKPTIPLPFEPAD